MGLNDVFQPIKSSLLSREKLPDVMDAFAIVFREESHRGIASSSSGSVSKPQIYGPNPNLLCKNYGKVGHTVDRCFDLIGYPPGYNKNPGSKSNCFQKTFNANTAASSSENGTTLSFMNEQMIKLMSLINEFDNQTSSRPHDNGRVSSAPNDDGNDQPCTRGFDTFDNSEADFATSMGDNPSSEANVHSSNMNNQNAQNLPKNISQVQPDLRRPGRNIKLPARFNDYVVGSSRKYGLEKYVSYSNLSKINYCFSTTFNKSSKPTTYYEAVKNPSWIKAMNNEIEAINRNNTWTICDLPE
uniref:Uncharacterized protein n=1 Tax=Tanacetum cinerariifolium TaxID=118510 RepID=A0A6L2JW07_TANCI|nr:hypothetical protein [Tanacetum cinerariifolium]